MLVRNKKTGQKDVITEANWKYFCDNGRRHNFEVLSYEGNTILPEVVDLEEVDFSVDFKARFLEAHTKSEMIAMAEIAESHGVELDYKKKNKQQLTDIIHG